MAVVCKLPLALLVCIVIVATSGMLLHKRMYKLRWVQWRIANIREPRTAICLSGNVRHGHQPAAAQRLRNVIDRLDPSAQVFAYVNPCKYTTQPWWWPDQVRAEREGVWQADKVWRPPACEQPWNGSSFLRFLKPLRLVQYNDSDTAPPPVCDNVPDWHRWLRGVYQQQFGVNSCYKMILREEKRRGRAFDFIVRLRADACKPDTLSPAIGCRANRYCRIDQLDPGGPIHWHWGDDGFAIVPRPHAEKYFTVVDDYKFCKHKDSPEYVGYPYLTGETVLKVHLAAANTPLLDMCRCHRQPTKACPRDWPIAGAPWEWNRWWAPWEWDFRMHD